MNESVSGKKGPMDWIWNTVFQCAQRICTVFEGKVPGNVVTFALEKAGSRIENDTRDPIVSIEK